jgi:hypothetical protein
MNAYQLAVMLEWRDRAEQRGEHANRVIAPSDRPDRPMRGCLGCFRDARILRVIGHRTGCTVAAADRH